MHLALSQVALVNCRRPRQSVRGKLIREVPRPGHVGKEDCGMTGETKLFDMVPGSAPRA